MKFTAEIITDANVYRVDLDGFTSLGAACDFVQKQLEHIEEAVFEGPDAILIIDLLNSKVKSYQVRALPDSDPLARMAAGSMTPPGIMPEHTGPREETLKAHYLGRMLRIRALVYDLGGQRYGIPLAVDGKKPLDAMSEANLVTMLQHNFPYIFFTLAPPVEMTSAEEVAYLVDFAEANRPQPAPLNPAERTAQAAGKVFEE